MPDVPEATSSEAAAPAASPWRVGESVPWSVAWTGEMGLTLQPSTEFPGLTDLVQEDNPGVGRPMFAVNHVTRGRLGLTRHICHVCGRETAPSDRWLFPVESGGLVTMTDGEVRYGVNVPPVHRACAERAQRQCPHLSGGFAEPVAFPTEDEGRIVPRTDIVPGMEEVAKMLPAGLSVILSCYRLFGPSFSQSVIGVREAVAARRSGVGP